MNMKKWLKENRSFVIFLLCLGFFRTAIADWNPVPSGSMRPTLLEGDVVLVNRIAYDFKIPLTQVSLARLGEPERGDIVTFFSPRDGKRLVKRLIGVPGDVIEMKDEVLVINGVASRYSDAHRVVDPVGDDERLLPALRATEHGIGAAHVVQAIPAVSAMRSFGPVSVPEDHYFFLGDSRDNSIDSRYYGVVPRSALIGRAHHILVSADILDRWQPRFDRVGARLD
jgi:signal peptidase I